MVNRFHVLRVVHVAEPQQPLGFADAFFGQRRGLVFFLDDVIDVLNQFRNDLVDAVVLVGGFLGGTRNDQRGAGLVDQDRVHFVHDSEVMAALNAVRQIEFHVVAEVIESEFVVRAVGDVGAIRRAPFDVAQIVDDHADGHAQRAVDRAHPLRVAPRARIVVCVDDLANVAELSAAAEKHGTSLECFVEIDCGAGRCGVYTAAEVVAIARAIDAAPGLKFTGIQAYQGAMQHLERYEDRKAKLDAAIAQVKEAVEALKKEGLEPELVSGGGTGSYYFESCSGVYNELQCGSYAFMDADYGRILDKNGKRIDKGEWENALFILTSVMSHAKPDKAICDAGLKAQSVDSGLPFVYGRDDVKYVKCTDEHGVIDDPKGVLKINEKLRLVPGHCDPTCNVHDWYVGIRKGKVETLWPISARGKAY